MKKGKPVNPKDAGKVMERIDRADRPFAEAQFGAFIAKQFGEYNKRNDYLPKRGRPEGKQYDDRAAVEWALARIEAGAAPKPYRLAGEHYDMIGEDVAGYNRNAYRRRVGDQIKKLLK